MDEIPELDALHMLDVFVTGRIRGRVRISRANPLVGELNCDSAGQLFLAPEPDERGGGMGSIQIQDLRLERVLRHVGQIVKVTGTFDPQRGLALEAIALREREFEDA